MMTENEFEWSCRLQQKIAFMQTDNALPWHKRKMANDADKAIGELEEYPSVSPVFLRKTIMQIEEAKEYENLWFVESEKSKETKICRDLYIRGKAASSNPNETREK